MEQALEKTQQMNSGIPLQRLGITHRSFGVRQSLNPKQQQKELHQVSLNSKLFL